MSVNESLVGKFLVSTPSMQESLFSKTIILICGQDEKGIVGLILNRPMSRPSLRNLLLELKLSSISSQATSPIYFGGPVDTSRGFVLHSPDYKGSDTMEILVENQEFCLTNRIDILSHISEGRGPQKFSFFLGYTGWETSQFLEELQENIWLLTDGRKDFIFGKEPSSQWKTLYRDLKINPDCLFTTSGRA
ncbi:MAG: YqgE/AlgH family protein [Proteobacteria bacterium]|nr:YqgE/AlgH family protein [Pseudomonadota bacterium]